MGESERNRNKGVFDLLFLELFSTVVDEGDIVAYNWLSLSYSSSQILFTYLTIFIRISSPGQIYSLLP